MSLAIDLFCGLGGWTEGLLAERYEVIGFDIERHDYGDGARYPAQLVLQDVMTIHGRQFKDAALIVASPPCQEYSYMAMPWSRAKTIRAEYLSGVRDRAKLTALFDACFRIQREACEAAGRHIPMVVENVRGAQEWVGRSRWNYGSFHLWGDIPALMPMAVKVGQKNNGGSWFAIGSPGQKVVLQNSVHDHVKTIGHANKRDGHSHTRHLTNQRESDAVKIEGDWFSDPESTCRRHSSKSKSRKAASAAIAKIPFTLSRYIAAHYKPQAVAA
jgi:C-5 cytosine-specific DNA methylase